MNESNIKAKLSFSDGSPDIDLPIYQGSVGPDVIDIRKLYGQTGKFTYLLLHVTARSPILMVTKANSCIAATPLKI